MHVDAPVNQPGSDSITADMNSTIQDVVCNRLTDRVNVMCYCTNMQDCNEAQNNLTVLHEQLQSKQHTCLAGQTINDSVLQDRMDQVTECLNNVGTMKKILELKNQPQAGGSVNQLKLN